MTIWCVSFFVIANIKIRKDIRNWHPDDEADFYEKFFFSARNGIRTYQQTKFGVKNRNLMVIKFIGASTHPQSKMQDRDLFL